MEKEIFEIENQYLKETLALVNDKINYLNNYSEAVNSVFDESNNEYLDYLSKNANKLNENDIVELFNMQGRLDDIEKDTIDIKRDKITYSKMLNKPYFARIDLQEEGLDIREKYYIGIHSLVNDQKEFKVVDWRSPIASIFYDYEKGDCQIKTNSSILHCNLLNKRQYGIENGILNYYLDTTINIEDSILQEALAKNTTNQMKTIVQTIQKEQNEVIRGDENKTLIVQGVAGSGKTAIALHRIAYLLYKLHGKVTSKNINFLSPNNAFSSYISSVLPDLAEDDIEKIQLDSIARKYLKKHLILENKYEQIERLICSGDIEDYKYKTSYQFVLDLIDFANKNYIDNFDIQNFVVRDLEIDASKIKELFFGRYKDRDLFTKFKWITDNIFDLYFYKVKTPHKIVRLKEMIFEHLYSSISNKNCVKAYMNFLKSRNMELELVGDKVKNEDAYAILFFKMFIYGLEKYENIKHLVIDEMQDYSPLQLYIINYLYDCPKTILGDYNQTINPLDAKNSQDRYNDIFSGDIQIIKLYKSYRATEEIANFYNTIGDKKDAQVVSRHGEKVDIINCNSINALDKIVELINNYKMKKYNSIALITRTNKDAKELYSKIKDKIPEINLIDDNVDAYNNDICVISAYNSKGLEFDGVIVYNASENYDSELDKNLLYIASSRALHKLSLITIDGQSKFLSKFKE